MLYEFIKERMLKHSEQLISDGTTVISYREFLIKAERLAKSLNDNLYVILCDNELNTAISLFACLCAGKTAAPLSSKYGEQHYNKIVEMIKPDSIIKDASIIHTNYDTNEKLHDVAVIMCSSGTTGVPKGIMLSEDNLYVNLRDIEKYMPVTSDDHMLISRPIFHCAVMTSELLYGLIRGSKILFYNGSLNPKRLYRIIEENRITVTSATPTIFYYLSKHINAAGLNCGLKTIAISGECMTESVAKELIKALPKTKKFNVYGLTEASPRVSYLPYHLFNDDPTSVGIPLNSTTIKIENDELLVYSPTIMQGYYLNSKATNETIKGGWLRTGDVAEINDGLLYIKCRKDNMIIRAGMNIYPQEIENVLKQDERILDVLAYSIKDNTVGEKLIINVIATNMTKNDVFRICKKLLPSYQYPDVIKMVDHFDYTPSGKIIRHF